VKRKILIKEFSALHFNATKLLKELYLQKLNFGLTVKTILFGLFGYLCAFIFGTYAENQEHRYYCPR
jgi:hypothetical protein